MLFKKLLEVFGSPYNYWEVVLVLLRAFLFCLLPFCGSAVVYKSEVQLSNTMGARDPTRPPDIIGSCGLIRPIACGLIGANGPIRLLILRSCKELTISSVIVHFEPL